MTTAKSPDGRILFPWVMTSCVGPFWNNWFSQKFNFRSYTHGKSNSAELKAALRQADVLSLHAPLTSQTQNLINAERLSWMKPTARLVNMARGGLVNLEDLCVALRRDQIAGAALDVLPVEPPGSELPALLDTPNLLISPHMGWSSRQARRRLVQTLAAHLKADAAGDN